MDATLPILPGNEDCAVSCPQLRSDGDDSIRNVDVAGVLVACEHLQAAVIDPRTLYSHIRVFSLDCPLISHHVSACSRMDVMDVDG